MGGLDILLSIGGRAVTSLTEPFVSGTLAWLLAGVFVLSGTVKLRQPVLVAQAFVNFGLTRRLYRRLGLAAGLVEVAVGLLLAARFWPVATTILATIALSFFVFLVARNLMTGNPSPCFCFGNFLTPVSWTTVVRTVGLALAGLVLTIAAAGDGIEFQAATTEAPQAIAALAVIGIVAISAPMLELVHWNAHPLTDAWS